MFATPVPAAPQRLRRGLLLVAAFVAVAGCTSLQAPPQPRALGEVAGLARQADGSLAWRAPQWSAGRLRIDAQSVAFAAGVALESVQASALREALVQGLRQEAQEAGLAVAADGEEEGEEAVQVRAVVTGVTLAQPLLNAAATVLLIGAVSRGGLDVELEAVARQRRVAALVYSGRSGVLNVVDGLQATGHAQQQARQAARHFARLLASAGEGSSAP